MRQTADRHVLNASAASPEITADFDDNALVYDNAHNVA